MPNAILTQLQHQSIINEMTDPRFRGVVAFNRHSQIDIAMRSLISKCDKLRYTKANNRVTHENGSTIDCVIINTRTDTDRLAGCQWDRAWILYDIPYEYKEIIWSRVRSTWHKNVGYSTFSDF